jgi:hypothetical protein
MNRILFGSPCGRIAGIRHAGGGRLEFVLFAPLRPGAYGGTAA